MLQCSPAGRRRGKFQNNERKDSPLPDNLLLIVFGTLTVIGILFAALCLILAVKNARRPEGELKMALWSFGALAGLVFAGMCFAYFIIPILINQWFHS